VVRLSPRGRRRVRREKFLSGKSTIPSKVLHDDTRSYTIESEVKFEKCNRDDVRPREVGSIWLHFALSD